MLSAGAGFTAVAAQTATVAVGGIATADDRASGIVWVGDRTTVGSRGKTTVPEDPSDAAPDDPVIAGAQLAGRVVMVVVDLLSI